MNEFKTAEEILNRTAFNFHGWNFNDSIDYGHPQIEAVVIKAMEAFANQFKPTHLQESAPELLEACKFALIEISRVDVINDDLVKNVLEQAIQKALKG